MTPKEKGITLIAKMAGELKFAGHSRKVLGQFSKSLALVAVDEILPCTWKEETYKKNGYTWVDPITTTEFWLEVKEEIKNL